MPKPRRPLSADLSEQLTFPLGIVVSIVLFAGITTAIEPYAFDENGRPSLIYWVGTTVAFVQLLVLPLVIGAGLEMWRSSARDAAEARDARARQETQALTWDLQARRQWRAIQERKRRGHG
ncbi:MAG: hypothetical protein AAFR93_15295 [Pseudomonadota bacterium]